MNNIRDKNFDPDMSNTISDKPKRKIHKIVVDRKLCIGAATCIVVAPKAYELDEESIAIVKEEAFDQDDDTLLMSAQSCPTQAIYLYDEDGNQVFP